MKNPKNLLRVGIVGTILLHTDSGHFDGHRGTGRPDGLSRLCASSGTGGIHRPYGLCVLAEKAL